MADKYAINFTCPICGGHQLNVSNYDDDNAAVSCGACGSDFGRWGDIKANLMVNQTPKAGPEEKPVVKGFTGNFKVGR
jgi:hypothetical protein